MNEIRPVGEHMAQIVSEPKTTPYTPVPAMTVNSESAATASAARPVICYAADAEVDVAMEKIFEKHDRLFSELAK